MLVVTYKILRLLSFIYFVVLTTLFSCGGDEDKAPNNSKPSKEYYIKFKADGEWKMFQVSEPGYMSCGQCACTGIPPLAQDNAGFSICYDNSDWITGAHIESWEDNSIDFIGSGFPIASFNYIEDGVNFYTEAAESQIGSLINITEISTDGNFYDYQMYKVKGTFQCKVRSDEGAVDISITEGTFVVRFSEDI